MADFPNIEPDAEQIGLVANTQIYESPLTRGVQTASLNGSRWTASPTYNNRQGKDARDLRAFIFNQDGAAGRFNYYPFTVDNHGTHAGGGVVDGAGQVGKSLLTKGWDGDQPLLFSAGDYLTINGEMKMVTTDVAGQDYIEYDEANYMPSPFDPSGWSGDPDGTITNVTIDNPSGQTFAGLFNQSGAGGFVLLSSFGNKQTFNLGDSIYVAFIYKIINASDAAIQIAVNTDQGAKGFSRFNLNTKSIISGSADDYKFTDLNDGFVLFEFKEVALEALTGAFGGVTLQNVAGGAMPIGSQLYVQAAFFGKNPLEFPYASYNEFGSDAELSEWTTTRCTTSRSGGSLNFLATATDPYITKSAATGLVAFDGEKYTDAAIRWKRNAGTTNNQLFFGNGISTYSINFNETNPDARAVTTGPDIDGFYTTIFYLANDVNWNGTAGGNISLMRFDMGNNSNSNFDIDYIEIYDPIAKEAYDDYWPAKLRANATIPITPALRVSPSDGNAIEVDNPYFPARLESDDQTKLQVSSNLIYSTTLSIVEEF